MIYNPARALELLRAGAGIAGVGFRDGQEEAIRHVVEGKGRLLVVQKTGWGKSFVYFIATKLLREGGSGPALLISPLLALMRNQIAAAERMGVRAATINSDNQDEWTTSRRRFDRDEVDILLISPERLANERFRTQVLAGIAARISLLVIDEAHCISDWGHDFRPHYRLLERIVRTLPRNLRLLATTATANNRVMDDLQTVLGPNLERLARRPEPAIARRCRRFACRARRSAWPGWPSSWPRCQGHGIIYTLTVRDAVPGGGLAAVARLERRGLHRRDGRSPRRAGAGAAGQSGEGAGRHHGAGDGLRQARPRLRDPLPDAGFGGRLLPAGRAGRPRARRGLRRAAERRGRDGHHTTTSSRALSRRARKSAQVLAALEAAPDGLSVPELLARVNLSKGRDREDHRAAVAGIARADRQARQRNGS